MTDVYYYNALGQRMRARLFTIEQRLEQFLRERESRSFARLIDAWARADRLPQELHRRLSEAVFVAAESPEWRLASAGVAALWVPGSLTRKADIIARGLLSKCESVRTASWGRIDGPRLARMVLSRLEKKPTKELMNWDVLMAVDQMANYLTSKRERHRLVQFVRRLEEQGTRSRLVEWKIEDTLYCDLHLNQPRAAHPG